MNAKGFAKRTLSRLLADENPAVLKAQIEKADLVSFDIFDTLVKRDVLNPHDVHDIVRLKYERLTGNTAEDYRELRLEAESNARKCSSEEEVTLPEIFSFLQSFSLDECKLLMRIEIETEKEICVANVPMLSVYEHALALGIPTVICSDMYLPREVIEEILNHCGIVGYSRLYLSSQLKKTKHHADVFDLVLGDYPDANCVVHVGDNPYGDFFQAKREGIKGKLIPTTVSHCRFWSMRDKKIDIKNSYLAAFINNRIGDDASLSRHIGYEVLGPLLFGYCLWLRHQSEQDGVQKLFFLSREGKILKEAYAIVCPDDPTPQYYLKVSRQALSVPLLASSKNFNDMIKRLRVFMRNDEIKTLQEVCKLDERRFADLLSERGLSLTTKVRDIDYENQAFLFDAIQKLGGGRFAEQRELAEEYLSVSGFNGKIGIVDVGYSGTMQSALNTMATEEVDSVGYYLGVQNLESPDYYADLNRKGYLYSPGINEAFHKMIRFSSEVFEFLLLNEDGSTSGYKRADDNGIIATLADQEYSHESAALSREIQSAAIEFLNDVIASPITSLVLDAVDPYLIMKPYSAFADYPDKDTIGLFGSVVFLDGSLRYIVPQHGMGYYFVHPDEFMNGLKESACKTFFLRKATGLPLPFFRILSIVSKTGIRSSYVKTYYEH